MDNHSHNQLRDIFQSTGYNPRVLICAKSEIDRSILSLIMGFEIDNFSNPQHALVFTLETETLVRFKPEGETNGVVCISKITQNSLNCVSLFVKSARRNGSGVVCDYVAFRQASYSVPVNEVINLPDQDKIDKAIKSLLAAIIQDNGGEKEISNEFFALYYLNDDLVHQTIKNSPAITLIDISSEPPIESPTHSVPSPTNTRVLGNMDISIDNI